MPESDTDAVGSVAGVVDQHPLLHLLGDHAKTRLLTALYVSPEPVNPTTLVERAGLGSRSWYNHREDLFETGLVREVGQAGNSPLYALAEGDPRIEALDVLASETTAGLVEADSETADTVQDALAFTRDEE